MDKIKHFTIPLFIPFQGCPFHCIFCDQEKITGQEGRISAGAIQTIINERLKTIPEGSIIEIGFFGGNFTGLQENLQEFYLEIVKPYLDNGKVSAIRLSTRPDFLDENKIDFLKNRGVKTIELGAQSMDNEVLLLSFRGHSAQDTEKSSILIKENGLRLGLQMIIGLPGDTIERSIATAVKITKLYADDVRIYPLIIIKGTPLHKTYLDGNYSPLELSTAVSWTKEVVKIFENAGTNIIRVGLHPSEDLSYGNIIAAGPFHPSFRQLVYSEIWAEMFAPLFIKKNQNIIIYTAPSELGYAAGFGGRNRRNLEKFYSKVSFRPDISLQNREYRVTC